MALRDDERHEMVQVIELRDVAVSQRTQAVNSVRGLCKAHGDRARLWRTASS